MFLSHTHNGTQLKQLGVNDPDSKSGSSVIWPDAKADITHTTDMTSCTPDPDISITPLATWPNLYTIYIISVIH